MHSLRRTFCNHHNIAQCVLVGTPKPYHRGKYAAAMSTLSYKRHHRHHLQQQHSAFPGQNIVRKLSSSSSSTASDDSSTSSTTTAQHSDGPHGDLFPPQQKVGPHLIGRTGRIQRTFGPQSNAQAMLVTGGEALAAHASFDPNYQRAKDWLRQHAVGPAVLSSPVLVSGVIGALVEAAFPQAVAVRQSMQQIRPLIVGVAVVAQIQVEKVQSTTEQRRLDVGDAVSSDGGGENQAVIEEATRRYGYEVTLSTKVSRVRDEAVIAEGEHVVWIPDYLSM